MERWTADEAREVVDRWRASGKSARTYGREHGVDPQRLHYWQRRLGAGAKRSTKSRGRAIARLVPAVVRIESGATHGHAVIVRLPGGVTVDVDPARVAPAWVFGLVEELARR